MSAIKLAAAAGLAVLGFAASAGVASAASAYATGNVNVRTGPSTHYSVVDVLRRGERVDVDRCRGSWCYVEKRGPDGWVSSNFLSNYDDYERPPIIVRPPPVIVRPPYHRPHHWPRPHWPDRDHGRHHGHDHDHDWRDRDHDRNGASFCYNGPNGYFCLGS